MQCGIEDQGEAARKFDAQFLAINSICSRLCLSWFTTHNRELALCGVSLGCGTSMLAAKLAIAFSRQGRRTLLVDADLHSPSQHLIFNSPQSPGLTNIIMGRADSSAIKELPKFPGLSLLSSGTAQLFPHNPFGLTEFGDLRTGIREHFDVILYDCANFKCSCDIYSISEKTHGVMLVGRKNVTYSSDMQAAIARLDFSKKCVISVVMARI
jgi:capsular exopolysaccharide synthesis family protein